MAFGREGGGRLGGDSSIYASRQDTVSSAANPPHWMKQLEEKYQRLHAKIVNQAAKFSNARFNAINNNINYNRSLSHGSSHRNNSISKSSVSSSCGGEGIQAVLAKRGAGVSNTYNKHNSSDYADTFDASQTGGKILQAGKRRCDLAGKSLISDHTVGDNNRARVRSVNNGIHSSPLSQNVSRRQSWVGEGGTGSADSGGGDSGSSTAPPPCPDHVSTTLPLQPQALRLARHESDAGKVTQAEIPDPVRATLAKTSAAIALLNSSQAQRSAGQVRSRGRGGSRLKSPQLSSLKQQTLDSRHTQADEDGAASESVYYIPAGISTSSGNKRLNSNTFNCFENEVSGVSVQHTPRASKPTTRASSSLALTRLSSANFVSVSRAPSRLDEELLDNAEIVNHQQDVFQKGGEFFTRRQDGCAPNVREDKLIDNGDVRTSNGDKYECFNEDDEIHGEDDDDDEEYYSCDDENYSDASSEDVFLEQGDSETEQSSNQRQAMEVEKGRGRRLGSRGFKTSAGRLGQKPHRSCPTYFWKSANPYASGEEDDDQRNGEGFSRTAGNSDTGHPSSTKNKRRHLHRKDRRANKSNQVKKNSSNHANKNNNKNNKNISNVINQDSTCAEFDGNDNRNLDQNLDENANDEFDDDPNCNNSRQAFHTNNQSQHRHHHHLLKPRRDSKGNISPVMGTVLPLTARAVEEGRMRVFARMSLEARHAVDETLREMERDEEKGDKEKTVERNLEGESFRPGHLEAASRLESTFDVSVLNNTSGTRGASRLLGDGDFTETGETWDTMGRREKSLDRRKEKRGSLEADSQLSNASDNLHDEFYAAGKLHSSNPNLFLSKTSAHQELMHSPSSSIGPYKRAPIAGQRLTSRRLPHLADVPTPPQSSSLPNPHARLPGIGNKPRLPLSYRETTFEITPPDFDIRFHHIITCHTEGRETPPPDIRQQSIDKCQQWLVRHNPK